MRWVWTAVLAGACAHAGSQPDAGFRVFFPDVAPRLVVHTHQHVQVKPTAACSYPDGREAHWAITGAHVTSGELPPGLVVEDGAIAGMPTKTGDWQASIVFTGVTCAGKAQPDQTADVAIRVAK